MTTALLLGASLLLLLMGALVSLLLARERRKSGWSSVAFVGGAATLLWLVSVKTFRAGAEPELTLVRVPALGAGLTVSVDCLSALFLAITASIALLTTLFSVEYMTRYSRDSVARYYPALQLLFVGIVGVVASADFLAFLVFWELMTLASFVLVAFEGDSSSSQRAALKYFVVNQAATLGMAAAGLILWKQSGSFHFSALHDAMGSLLASQPASAHVVLFLFFIGFATKAGILPMGDWLPDAYPAAPSGATAAFGGAMTKLGVYGLLRVFLSILPLGPATGTWGLVLLLAGTASLFVGTLMALQQDDSKRLMSFHVIGQVGYMFLGVGLGLFFLRSHPALGALGLMAGVFHLLNHSLYKACLFLGAGAVHYRTGTRSLNALGGLAPFMPLTALCAATAALAIAGVPPLNGFASKWLLYVTAIQGAQRFPLFAIVAIVAMFVSLLTLASFLKYLGGAFLGLPSTRVGLREVPASMLIPQAVLGLACVALGLMPGWPLRLVHRALIGAIPEAGLPGFGALLGTGAGLQVSAGSAGVAAWGPLACVGGLAVLVVLSILIQRAGGAQVRDVSAWNCGEEHPTELVRYPAGSFYGPLKHAFRGIYPALTLEPPHFPRWLRRAFDVDAWLYLPSAGLVERGAAGLSRTHVGVPQVYLLWILLGAAVVVGILLGVAR